MTPIIPHRKEKPLTSLASLGGGAAGMANAGLAENVYGEDIFSTYLWIGNNSARSIVNGIDLAGKGGMTWMKRRSAVSYHQLFDTERGATKQLYSNEWDGEFSSNTSLTSFNDNGFSIGDNSGINSSGDEIASWTFRKQKGFFDVVKYTGNSTAGRNISHSLGCVPGMILIKFLGGNQNWAVYHRETGASKFAHLNRTDAFTTSNGRFYGTEPTATHFTVGADSEVNGDTLEYVAYLFAGGESTASSATSVDFDGSGDYLSIPDSEDFNFGNGNFCVELWIKSTQNNTNRNIIGQWGGSGNHSWSLYWSAPNQGHNGWGFKYSTNGSNQVNLTDTLLNDNQWYHIAVVRNGDTLYLYRNGTLKKKASVSGVTFNNVSIDCRIANDGYDSPVDCHISNVRVVKGSPVYTSSFKVSYKPLTNIANTVLLCCNGSTTTSSTVTPGTITANGDPTVSSDSPFDDPDGFKFGEEGDQNMIKCGSHSNPATNPIRIYTGWEPQWILVKNADQGSNWGMFDVMRGIFRDDDGPSLVADLSSQENAVLGSSNQFQLHADGFTINYGLTAANPGNSNKIVYMAVRRFDGYVSKPEEAGTGAYTQAYGNGAGTNPSYVSNFPVDFAINRQPATAEAWYTATRLTGRKYVFVNNTNTENTANNYVWDHNNGWRDGSAVPNYLSWMWKRGPGFDLVTYDGNADSGGVVTENHIPHSLGTTPEMMWVKRRDSGTGTARWYVYHKGLNGGSNPARQHLYLNDSNAAMNGNNIFNNTDPTASHFTVGGAYAVNEENKKFLAVLFASVDGISKIGYYTGDGSNESVTTGFQPRFILIRRIDYAENWFLFDSTRGLASGSNDPYMLINDSATSSGSASFFDISSTGFTVTANFTNNNVPYIYYAHA